VGVFHQPKFDQQLSQLSADLQRLQDALRYDEWLLSEFPETGIESDVPGIFVAPTRLPTDEGMVRASIFYTYDGKDVTFHRLVRAP